MNKVILIGRIGQEPDVRSTTTGSSSARYSLAVNRGKDKDGNDMGTDWINCVAFGRTADFVEKYLKKGTKILVEGHIRTGSYQKQDGTKVYTTDVVVDRHEFVEARATETATEAVPDFMSIPDGLDEELPFIDSPMPWL